MQQPYDFYSSQTESRRNHAFFSSFFFFFFLTKRHTISNVSFLPKRSVSSDTTKLRNFRNFECMRANLYLRFLVSTSCPLRRSELCFQATKRKDVCKRNNRGLVDERWPRKGQSRKSDFTLLDSLLLKESPLVVLYLNASRINFDVTKQ